MSHAQRHASIGIHGLHEHEGAHHIQRLRLLRRAKLLAGLILLGLAGGSALVIGQRLAHARELSAATEINAQLHVGTVLPQASRGEAQLQLPGSLQGVAETPIYARSSGYVTRWTKDIGDTVKAGELLAEISTVEVEQQLAEARAARQQAQAALQLARTSYERWQVMRQRDAVSQQELDERHNALKLGEANLAAAEANVQRLEQLLAYNRIVAPFAGVVTKRNIDIGNLVDAGNGGAPKQLYMLSQTDPLRVYVAVPQSYAPRIQLGMPAQLSLAELPGQVFSGQVVRSARAIDPLTRTLQIEIRLPNHDGKLLPGAYATVELKTGNAGPARLTVPNNALLFRPEGTMLAVVDAGSKVHLQKVHLGRDLGAQVEVLDGLGPTDRVIVNPPDALNEGDAVVATDFKPSGPKAPEPPKSQAAPTAKQEKSS